MLFAVSETVEVRISTGHRVTVCYACPATKTGFSRRDLFDGHVCDRVDRDHPVGRGQALDNDRAAGERRGPDRQGHGNPERAGLVLRHDEGWATGADGSLPAIAC